MVDVSYTSQDKRRNYANAVSMEAAVNFALTEFNWGAKDVMIFENNRLVATVRETNGLGELVKL